MTHFVLNGKKGIVGIVGHGENDDEVHKNAFTWFGGVGEWLE